jgi:hypothetical protein
MIVHNPIYLNSHSPDPSVKDGTIFGHMVAHAQKRSKKVEQVLSKPLGAHNFVHQLTVSLMPAPRVNPVSSIFWASNLNFTRDRRAFQEEIADKKPTSL